MNQLFEPVIGLEIHVELKTKNKMFCQCGADYFGSAPNSNTCPVCLGLPGALPVPNRTAIEWTIKIASALGCKINLKSKFDRKHYFYPDLPKGYQISQYDEPIGGRGELMVRVRDEKTNLFESKSFGITRVHLEEDTGKNIHAGEETVMDFNRSSVPLVEIVTEPDFRNSDDVKAFLTELHTIIRYLDVSDADMEKGSMRMEPNISVRKVGETELPNYKVEVKNINSFRFVKKAIDFEVKRHSILLEKGETPKQETRGWNEAKNETYAQRSKENAHDYRYFPDPDIPPLEFTQEQVAQIAANSPKLPAERVAELTKRGVKEQDAYIITREPEQAGCFDITEQNLRTILQDQKIVVENVSGVLASLVVNKKLDITLSPLDCAKKAAELLKPVETDHALLDTVVARVITDNPTIVADYKGGKENAIMALVGKCMKELHGKATAPMVIAKIKQSLE